MAAPRAPHAAAAAAADMMSAVERTAPPSAVRLELRREVEFCCPVDSCPSPYLTWHHFDPPWHTRQHHDPTGMVALCLQHHKEADAGAFAPDQLRAFKTTVTRDRPVGRFNWKREQLILRAGGGLYVGCTVFLEMAGHQMIWLTADDDGNQMLNMDVRGAHGKLAFAMRDNCWTVLTELDDVEAPPSARSLVLRAPRQEVQVSVKFTATTRATLLSGLRDQLAKPNRSLEREMAARERRVLAELECQWPSGSPQLRPSFLPARGHDFSPLVAIVSPHRGVSGWGSVQGRHPLAGGCLREPVAVLAIGEDHVSVVQEPLDGRGGECLWHQLVESGGVDV